MNPGSAHSGRRSDALALLALLGISGVLWRLRVLGPRSLRLDPFGNTDQYNYFYPLHRLVAARWAHGHLPLWNPQQLAGLPLLATPQAAAFYPPNLLHVLLPSEHAMQALAFSHLLLAGATLYALCRTLGARSAAAAIGGMAYAWSSYVVGCHLWPPCVAALAWFPLPLLGVALIARQRPQLGLAALSGGIAALILSGHVPLAMYGLHACAAYALWQIARPWPNTDRKARAKLAARLGLGFCIGLLLAAPQWLPTLELVRLATRSPTGLTAQQLEPFGALPGSMFRLLFVPSVRGGGYAGVATLLLIPLAFTTRRLRSEALFFVALALIFALISLGTAAPFYALYAKLPGSNLFRGPARAMCLFTLGTSVTSALAIENVLHTAETRTAQRWPSLLLIVASAAALSAFDLNLPAWLLPASATAVMAYSCLPEPWQPLGLAAIGCVLAVDLGMIPTTPDVQIWRPHALDQLQQLDPLYSDLAARLGGARCIIRPSREFAMATAPRVAAMHGLRVFEDYEPLSLQRYADYATFMQHGQLYDPQEPALMYAGEIDRQLPIIYRKLLASAGVRAIARMPRRASQPATWDIDWLQGALPRAYVVHDLRSATSALDTLHGLARGELGRNAVALEKFAATAAAPQLAADSGETARIINDEPERVRVDVTLKQAGALMLLDIDYPGWRATVDGQPTRIYNANYLFRAVILNPGRHRVSFHYVATRLWLGFVLSALGLLLGLWQARDWRSQAGQRPAVLID